MSILAAAEWTARFTAHVALCIADRIAETRHGFDEVEAGDYLDALTERDDLNVCFCMAVEGARCFWCADANSSAANATAADTGAEGDVEHTAPPSAPTYVPPQPPFDVGLSWPFK